MKKKNAIYGLIICVSLLVSSGYISQKTSANAGYALGRWISGGNGYVENALAGAGGAAGGLGATWAGAKIGGKIGGVVGGPVGIIVGAGLGAL